MICPDPKCGGEMELPGIEGGIVVTDRRGKIMATNQPGYWGSGRDAYIH